MMSLPPKQLRSLQVEECPVRSNAYHAVLLRLERFARDESVTILLNGESGTGKTTLARRIHEMSPRARGPFQRVVLSAIDDGIAASDIAGHVAGAYTDARRPRAGHFASAAGGTLFLDEIGKASLGVQNKLLDAIERREITPVGSDRTVKVDVRIIAATNVDLAELVAAGKFLPDLFARLKYFQVEIPPLRERRADLPALIASVVQRHAVSAGYPTAPELDDRLLAALKRAPWIDNLRGLDSFVHRLLLEADGAPILTLGHCTGDLLDHVNASRDKRDLSDDEVAAAIRQTGSLSGAARLLGKDRKTLRPIANRLTRGESQQSTVQDAWGAPPQQQAPTDVTS